MSTKIQRQYLPQTIYVGISEIYGENKQNVKRTNLFCKMTNKNKKSTHIKKESSQNNEKKYLYNNIDLVNSWINAIKSSKLY